MNGWQPIETGPLEVDVLVWDGANVTIAAASIIGRAVWFGKIGGDRIYDGDGERASLIEVSPTHWMTLPEPPK